jgi:THO complex subunit 4
MYDRMDRSEGTAFVIYQSPRDARDAVADFNGCNANGQPIKLSILPTAPAAASKGSLFDRVERPTRSLFDRIEVGTDNREDSREDTRRRRNRSESPRRRDTPERVDRYVPRGARSRSPIRRRGTPREQGRRPGQRREDSGRGGRRGRTDEEGRPMVGGRPKKTAQELDAEMEDYWGSKPSGGGKPNGAPAASNGNAAPATTAAAPVDDIDMIE